jgi:hypothetical protein
MGFAFRVNRGMRVALTPRGVRAGIGPRLARLHVGSGPVGVSTGVGPFTTWTSLGGGKSSRAQGGASSARLEAYEAALAEHEALMVVHRERFAPAQPPVLAAAEPAGRAEIEERTYDRYRAGIKSVPWWRIAERKAVHRQAANEILAEVEAEYQEAVARTAIEQERADAWWQALLAGDPETVIDALNDAFFDNVHEAICLDFADGEASIALAMPPIEDVPERFPTLTPTGLPTTKAYNLTDRNELHLQVIFAHVAVTLREAFAVVPSLQRVRIVVLEQLDQVEVMLAGLFDRAALDFLGDDPAELLDRGEQVIVNRVGRTGAIGPIDRADEPDLQELTAMATDLYFAVD